jgi:hypothetical protein
LSAGHEGRSSRGAAIALALASLLAGAARPASAGDTTLGGDLRYYQFVVAESEETERDHAEVAVLRAKLESELASSLRFTTHAVLELRSPNASLAGRGTILSGETPRFFDLSIDAIDDEDLLARLELDRLELRWDRPSYRLTLGRQAVTWGVAYFWPVLDLFAPFAPQQVDRDYKAGVDAVRLTIPAGDFSEVDLIAAGQGEDLPEDGSVGALGRLHAGGADFGFMAGSFHTDAVAGAFATADVGGTGLRGEVAYTKSGDDADAEIDRERFARATLGVDRQLTPLLTLIGEVAWNGYGVDDPALYRRLAQSDRVRRGEVTSLGRRYAGLSLSWQPHPLWTLGAALLLNGDDGSTLFQPTARWSLSDAATLELGIIAGAGPGLSDAGAPRSEYGGVPATVWAAIKAFF